MPEILTRLTSISLITGLELARRRSRAERQTGSWTGNIGRQRFMPDARETDWREFVKTYQHVTRPAKDCRRHVEIIVPMVDIKMGQKVEVHPDKDLIIVLQFPGVNITGEFIPGKKIYGEGNTVFYAPVSFWRDGQRRQTSLIVATWAGEMILESQIALRINKNPLFQDRISLQKLADHDPELQGVNPDISKYNLSGMQISEVGNIVTVTYPHY